MNLRTEWQESDMLMATFVGAPVTRSVGNEPSSITVVSPKKKKKNSERPKTSKTASFLKWIETNKV